jgi:hypothetical protein
MLIKRFLHYVLIKWIAPIFIWINKEGDKGNQFVLTPIAILVLCLVPFIYITIYGIWFYEWLVYKIENRYK